MTLHSCSGHALLPLKANSGYAVQPVLASTLNPLSRIPLHPVFYISPFLQSSGNYPAASVQGITICPVSSISYCSQYPEHHMEYTGIKKSLGISPHSRAGLLPRESWPTQSSIVLFVSIWFGLVLLRGYLFVFSLVLYFDFHFVFY